MNGGRLGCNSTHAVEFASKIGPLGWCRCFAQAQTWTTGGPWKAAIDANARGERVILTYKPGSVSAAISGAEDARAAGIANGLKAAGIRDGVIGILHEPEDDVEKGSFTAAQWVAMQVRLLPKLKAILGPLGWRTSVCLMGWTLDPASHRSVGQYLTTELLAVVDVIGFDPYNKAGAGGGATSPWATVDPSTRGAPATLFGLCLDEAKRRGKTPMVFEVGCFRRQADTSGAERSKWWESVLAYGRIPEFEAFCHFEMGIADNWGEVAIRNEPRSAAAFKALGATAAPPETDAEKIERLIFELDLAVEELEAKLAEVTLLKAERDTLNDQLVETRDQLTKVIADRDRLAGKLATIHEASAP